MQIKHAAYQAARQLQHAGSSSMQAAQNSQAAKACRQDVLYS